VTKVILVIPDLPEPLVPQAVRVRRETKGIRVILVPLEQTELPEPLVLRDRLAPKAIKVTPAPPVQREILEIQARLARRIRTIGLRGSGS
jgi:hypothetical protein